MAGDDLVRLREFLPIVINFVILVVCGCCTIIICWMFSVRLKAIGDQHAEALERLWVHITAIVSDQSKIHLREFERLHDAIGNVNLAVTRLAGDQRLLTRPESVGLDHARVSGRPVVVSCDDSEGTRRMVRKSLTEWANERGIDIVITPDWDKYTAARESLTTAGRKIFGSVLDWTKAGQNVVGIREPVVILTASPDAVTSMVLGMPNVTVFSKSDGNWPTALPKELERLAKVVEDLQGAK